LPVVKTPIAVVDTLVIINEESEPLEIAFMFFAKSKEVFGGSEIFTR
jgi:hypothetical protein